MFIPLSLCQYLNDYLLISHQLAINLLCDIKGKFSSPLELYSLRNAKNSDMPITIVGFFLVIITVVGLAAYAGE